MGKRLRLQRRGKGSPKFKATINSKVDVRYNYFDSSQTLKGQIIQLFSDPIRSAPVAKILFENGSLDHIVAPEGCKTGDRVVFGKSAENKSGNVLFLEDISPGSQIFNIEKNFGDGGKFARATGQSATLMSKKEGYGLVKMPSGQMKNFPLNVRATIGIVAGSGRPNKPFVKAGNKFHAMKAKGKPYPTLRGVAMNAVDHPFGGLQPSGRKVGAIASKRTGRKKK